VLGIRHELTLEDVNRSHACSLEACVCVTDGIYLECPLSLTVATIHSVQTLKVFWAAAAHGKKAGFYVFYSGSNRNYRCSWMLLGCVCFNMSGAWVSILLPLSLYLLSQCDIQPNCLQTLTMNSATHPEPWHNNTTGSRSPCWHHFKGPNSSTQIRATVLRWISADFYCRWSH
jgi:hypothetical protein